MSTIHINPKNKGKFNATKKRTGKTTEELTHSKNPVTRKRAVFALNAKKWKHEMGGDMSKANLALNLFSSLSKNIPIFGQIAAPMVQSIQGGMAEDAQLNQQQGQILDDHLAQTKTATNPYGYEKGGNLGYSDLIKYNGPTHDEGGIAVGNTGMVSSEPTQHEVEGEETAWKVGDKTYIFSNKYKL